MMFSLIKSLTDKDTNMVVIMVIDCSISYIIKSIKKLSHVHGKKLLKRTVPTIAYPT